MNCDQCGGLVAITDRFCEECGANLLTKSFPPQPGNGCQKCGASANRIDIDRYCVECGFRQTIAVNDHLELQSSPSLAGVSDRGHRHHQNEDAIALKFIEPDTYAIVVCDGVSSSQHPELAAQSAVIAYIEQVETALKTGIDPNSAALQGVSNALTAVANIPWANPREDPPSTTIVAAIVRDQIATITWLGDSRAYWLAADRSYQLTEDDSWMREAIAAGTIPSTAEKSPYAHAITRWLGADVVDDGIPNLVNFTIPGQGYLLLCTDGLWNYAPDPAYLSHLIQQTNDTNPLAIACALVRYANQQGGQDNTTVGILAIAK